MQREKPQKEFDELLLEVRRVTRVTTGGRRMSFRATIVVGNKKGKIGVASAKGADVSIAVQKATHEAYKNIFVVPVAEGNTVPYPVVRKFKSAVVKLIPASVGTGMKAGSAVRSVLELAGYENMLSKIVGSNNKLNNALATIYALAAYKHASHFSVVGSSTKKIDPSEKDVQEDATVAPSTPTSKAKKAVPAADSSVAPVKKASVKKDVGVKTPVKKAAPKAVVSKKVSTTKVAAKKTPKESS